MCFGLRTADLDMIIRAIDTFDQIEKAAIFGSRAKGTQKIGSDIDIAIYGEHVTFDVVAKLHAILEEQSPMPYFFDIVDYSHLNHQALKEHIDRVGQVIFERQK